jgi:hypothetical protein
MDWDWKDDKISDWRKLLRICFNHGFKDIDCRGIGVDEIAKKLKGLHWNDLKPDELEFIEGILR